MMLSQTTNIATITYSPSFNAILPDSRALPQPGEIMTSETRLQADVASAERPHFIFQKEEIFYIQLFSELAFAMSTLPDPPYVLMTNETMYDSFCDYFASRTVPSLEYDQHSGASQQISCEEFVKKIDNLVGAVLWRVHQSNEKTVMIENFQIANVVPITTTLLDEYTSIRQIIGFNTYVTLPKNHPELWEFLERTTRNHYPDLCEAPVAEDTAASESIFTTADERKQTISAATIPQVIPGTHKPTSMPDDDVEESEVDPDNNSVLDTFKQLKMGPIQCTALTHDGKPCRRTDQMMPESVRTTWLCHNHDPEQLRQKQRRLMEKKAKAKRPFEK